MTLFISEKNQQLLWNIINNNQDIKNLDLEFKSNWFKQTISIYYEKYINTYLTTKNIIDINKEFILHIKNDIKFIKEYNSKKDEENKKYIQEIEEQEKYKNQQKEKQEKESYLNSYNSETKEDGDISRNFHERQTEYTNLLTPKPPDDVDFSETKDDEPITNIDELLKKQQEEREYMDKISNSMYEKYVTDNKLLDKKEDDELEVIDPS